MKRLRFVWIDDKASKVEAYRDVVEAGLGNARASIELIEIKNDALEVLGKWSSLNKKGPPDLFVIDHIFIRSLPFGLKGSSIAHLLRGTFPKVPMVCVTAMFDEPNTFDQEDISEYTALFLYQNLENHIEDLFAVAKDFPKLHSPKKGVRQHVIACLKAPSRDKEDLSRVLPEEFQDETHATTQHRVARWIFGVLLRRAGFVYDRLFAATLLGLTEGGLRKVEPLFERALYRGVFATERDPRWWATAIRNVLFDIAGEDAPDLPQYAGRTLPGISKDDYSVCYISKRTDPPPDAVVFADATRNAKRRVVRRQYSEQHPNDLGITPGFETRLILKKTSK